MVKNRMQYIPTSVSDICKYFGSRLKQMSHIQDERLQAQNSTTQYAQCKIKE